MHNTFMKIGIDVSDLCTDRADGTTRYTRELVHRLPTFLPEAQFTYFAPSAPRSKDAELPGRWMASPWPKYWTQFRLPFDLYRAQPDVLFMPIQQLPYVRPGRMKTVAVMHDLAVHRFPEYFTRRDWLLLHTFSAQVARSADHIIAVSEATAQDISKYYGRSENVHVVHHGVDHDFFRAPTENDLEAANTLLHSTLPRSFKRYLLYVGQIQPRKNLERLVAAFEVLAQDDPELGIVLAGGHGWLREAIENKIEASPFKDRIYMPGRVSADVLKALYWQAEVFVFPSLYEGFGLPLLEAFAAGCPVVTSNVSSLPEIAGEAAVIVDPFDVKSIVAGIVRAQGDRDALRKRGFARAGEFSWKRCAEETATILTKI